MNLSCILLLPLCPNYRDKNKDIQRNAGGWGWGRLAYISNYSWNLDRLEIRVRCQFLTSGY